MRIGINIPLKGRDGLPLTAEEVKRRARMVEAAGFDSVWMQDSLTGQQARPDPLQVLALACAGTEHIEVLTSILVVPTRDAVDLAYRFLTLQALTHGRFSVGVGAGSSEATHASVGNVYEDRFKILYGHMDIVRRLLAGEAIGAANLAPWPSTVGGPHFLLGAWHSERSLRRAVAEYDGWMASAGPGALPQRGGWKKVLGEGIAMYRDLGGTRALAASARFDLSAPYQPMGDADRFSLECPPEAAAERLQSFADLGYDDILLAKGDHTGAAGLHEADYREEELLELRSLFPRDDRPPYPATASVATKEA